MLKYTKDMHREWVDAVLNDRVKDLNDYETDFIDSMDEKLLKGIPLTGPMEEVLERIYARVTN